LALDRQVDRQLVADRLVADALEVRDRRACGGSTARLPTDDFSRLFCRQVPAASPWKLARNLPAAVSSLNAYTVLCADVVPSVVGHSEQSGKERSENPCPAQDHPGTLARGVR
jgi:hypothetical protein